MQYPEPLEVSKAWFFFMHILLNALNKATFLDVFNKS